MRVPPQGLQCVWVAVCYDALRKRGTSHPQSLRCLGQRRLRIIWKMWQTGTVYDSRLHLRNQIADGSWVLHIKPS